MDTAGVGEILIYKGRERVEILAVHLEKNLRSGLDSD
jgi:hypothetical protein